MVNSRRAPARCNEEARQLCNSVYFVIYLRNEREREGGTSSVHVEDYCGDIENDKLTRSESDILATRIFAPVRKIYTPTYLKGKFIYLFIYSVRSPRRLCVACRHGEQETTPVGRAMAPFLDIDSLPRVNF